MDKKKCQIVVGSKTKGSVRYDIEQTLSDIEKDQAKNNINATGIIFTTWEDSDHYESNT